MSILGRLRLFGRSNLLNLGEEYITDSNINMYLSGNLLRIDVEKNWNLTHENDRKVQFINNYKIYIEKDRRIYITESLYFQIVDLYDDRKRNLKWIDLKFNSDYYDSVDEDEIANFIKTISKLKEETLEHKKKYTQTLAYIAKSLSARTPELNLDFRETFETMHSVPDILYKFLYGKYEEETEKAFLRLIHSLYSDMELESFAKALTEKSYVECDDKYYPSELYGYVLQFAEGNGVNTRIINFAKDLGVSTEPSAFIKRLGVDLDSIKVILIFDTTKVFEAKQISSSKAIYEIGDLSYIGYSIFPNEKEWFESNLKKIISLSETDLLAEKITHIVLSINTDSRSIKYKIEGYVADDSKNVLGARLTSNKLENQEDIIDFTKKVFDFCKKYRKLGINSGIKSKIYISEEDINNSIFFENADDTKSLKIKDISSLYNLLALDQNAFYCAVSFTLYDLLKDLIDRKYKKNFSSIDFLDLVEIRCLPPVMAIEFKNRYEGHKTLCIGEEQLAEAFKDFIIKKNYVCKSEQQVYLYGEFIDEYNVKPILFREQLNIAKYPGWNEQVLKDGRIFHTSNYHCLRDDNFEHYNKLINFIDEFSKKVNSYVHYIEWEENVYEPRLEWNGMYRIAGYIVKPYKGNFLTAKKLLSFSNKDLYRFIGRFCTLCVFYKINFKDIALTEDFDFYINTLDTESNFEINNIYFTRKYFIKSVKYFLDKLEEIGYDLRKLNAIRQEVEDAKSEFENEASCINFFDTKAEKSTCCCKEHGFWYNPEDGECPICKSLKRIIDESCLEMVELVYEDNFGKHYKFNEDYYVKIYKPGLDMEKLKSNVSSFVDEKIDLYTVGQDCFIPVKMAYNLNNEFIGYLYKAVAFTQKDGQNGYCINILDSSKLKNLPRLKCLIRLAKQTSYARRKYGFISNPYGDVFLHVGYKKQVQILNIDFLGSGESSNFTPTYIRQAINNSEDFFMRDDRISKKRYNELVSFMEAKANSLTKYCSIHNMYYESKSIFCPMCVDSNLYEGIDIDYQSRAEYDKLTPINQGGESFIYSVNGGVVKIFNDKIDYSLKNMVLLRILLKRKILEEIDIKYYGFRYVMPGTLLVDSSKGEIFGYNMELISRSQPISLLRDKAVVHKKYGFTRLDILQIAITIGMGIEFLHEQGVFIGDLNGSNILFDKDKRVYFIDFDGMGVDEFSPDFCTDGYIDPISKKNKNITMKDDWYSFAVQIFHYLTYTHPFNGVYFGETNGRKVPFDIVDKMEHRISLLGNHGINIPDVAEPWDDWMTDELKNTFLDIFENEKRENFVPVLKDQFTILLANCDTADNYRSFMESVDIRLKTIELNSKFEAVEYYPSKDKRPKFTISSNYDTRTTRLIQDGRSSKWIKVTTVGEITQMKATGTNSFETEKSFNVGESIKIANVCYRNGNVFIPCDGYLLIANEKDQTVKRMECSMIMTPDSKLYNFNSTGYCVMTNDRFFKIYRKK